MSSSVDLFPPRRPLFFPVVIATVLLTVLGMTGGYLLRERHRSASTSAPLPGAQAGSNTGGPALPIATEPMLVVADAAFETPSRNITCVMSRDSVRCDIARKDWAPPAKPASCTLAWGNGIVIENGKAQFTCAGDTTAGKATMILPYGASVRAGHVQCDSNQTALRCEDQRSETGFTLAIARYNLF